MPDPARNLTENDTQQQEKPDPKPWLRQKGESTLWFNRFCLYQDLGYKRTLQAAVEKERSKIKALKSTDIPASAEQPGKLAKTRNLKEVPPTKAVQVPGSWKHASVEWQWVKRAAAWDAYALDYMVEKNMERLLETNHALPMTRVHTLQSMIDSIGKTYNNCHDMTYEQDCMYIARMQSLLRDIREEMKLYNEPLQRMITRRHCIEAYQGLDSVSYEGIVKEQERRKAEQEKK
jgi:hypothetical protein